jgi:acyl carrier protein
VSVEGASSEVPGVGEIAERIRSFVCGVILSESVAAADPLADNDFDSLALEQLLDYLEESYHVLFTPEDIARPNLASLAIAAEMVHRRVCAVAAGEHSW